MPILLLQAQQALVSASHLPTLLMQLGINLIAVFLLSYIYYRKHKNTDYVFTFFMFNILIFFICYYMVNIELGVGFGFGLFALFSILRYRTATVLIKEMTYLFAVIAIAVINSLSIHTLDWVLTTVANTSIISAALLLDVVWLRYPLYMRRVVYEKIDLIKPENRPQLLADLNERLGVEVVQIAIENVNFLNDTATLYVFYKNTDGIMVQIRRDD